ncbi:MAG TPA: hypothetical protein VK859_00745 [bacterium]|jgi:hypothetical protein|nr:hypothetical protein [bacterium]
MKYFTSDMWRGVNSSNKAVFKKTELMWKRNGKAYSKQLEVLKKYLGKRNYSFFKNVSLHDSIFISFKFNQYKDENIQKILSLPFDLRKRTIEIITKKFEKNQIVKLIYKKVFSVFMDLPQKASLFDDSNYLGDWGYDELTLDKNDHFQHEILFSTGATIKIIFEKFDFKYLTKPET